MQFHPGDLIGFALFQKELTGDPVIATDVKQGGRRVHILCNTLCTPQTAYRVSCVVSRI